MKPYRMVDGHAQYLTPEQQRDVVVGVEETERWREHRPAAKPKANARVPSPSRGPAQPGLVVERWSEFRDRTDDQVDYIVDGVAPAGSVGFISAGPKKGKTWQGLHIAVAVATGKPVMGRFTTRASDVAYLALEGQRANIKARIGCLARGVGVDPDTDELERLRLIYRPKRVDLRDPESAAQVIAAVSDLEPGLLIVDVLRRAARIRESGEGVADFTQMLDNLEPLISAGWTTVLLHHFRKWSDTSASGDTGDRMSGSGALFGNADFAVFIVNSDRAERRYDLEFISRDGAHLPDMTVRIFGEGSGAHGGLTYNDAAVVTSVSDEDAAKRRIETIDAAILGYVEKHPGDAKRRVLDGVGGNRNETDTRLNALVLTGRVVVQPGHNNAKLHYLPHALPSTVVTLDNDNPASGVTALPTPVGGNATTTGVTSPSGTSTRPGGYHGLEDGGW